MPYRHHFFAPIGLVALMALAGASSVSAQTKKLTYDQAFAKCKEEISKNGTLSESLASSQRYAAGGACMKKAGYRLKKGAKI